MLYNFKGIGVVPTAKDFVDIVLSKTQRQTPTVVRALSGGCVCCAGGFVWRGCGWLLAAWLATQRHRLVQVIMLLLHAVCRCIMVSVRKAAWLQAAGYRSRS